LTEKRVRGSGSNRVAGSHYRTALLPGATVRSVAASAALVLGVLGPAVLAAPAAIGAGPTVSSRPLITGVATQGSRLTARSGSWHGSSAIRFAYRWYRCDTMGRNCTPLRGATGPRHKLGADDVPLRLLLGLLVCANRSVKPVAIGDRECKKTSVLGRMDHLFGPRRPFEEGEIRLGAELGERTHRDLSRSIRVETSAPSAYR